MIAEVLHLIPKPIRRVARKLVDETGLFRFQQQLGKATPILVYQMGKVGSSSVYESLLNQYRGVVLHSHGFSESYGDPKTQLLYRWVTQHTRALKIISLTREPIGRNISAFFHNFERDTGVPYADSKFSTEELRSIFLSNYDHDFPLNWFDKTILDNFGIDVFSRPFPSHGFTTYSNANVSVLVMRSEIADREKVTAIKEFLGVREFQLVNTNIGARKDYAAAYRAFIENVRLPPEYVEKMCESRYFRHFYDEAAISAARQRWSEDAGEN